MKPWFKMEADFYDNPKVLRAGLEATAVWIMAIGWCCRNLTDGVIPVEILERFVPAGSAPDVLARLYDSGLVDEGDTARTVRVHDYLAVQRSADEVDRLTETRSRAGAAGGKASAVAKGQQILGNEEGKDAPDIDIDIETHTARRSVLAALQAEFDAIWAKYPKKLARKMAFDQYVRRRQKDKIPAEMLARAVENFGPAMADREPRYIMQGSVFFGPNERWKDYVEPEQAARNGRVDFDKLT